MVENGVDLESFSDDGDEDVDRDGDRDLGLDRFLAGVEKGLDAEVLLERTVRLASAVCKSALSSGG